MDEPDWLARQFEENRSHLREVAHRILGSPAEADDAVQEAWLRLSGSDARKIENLGGWLTTVIARVCLDALRVRKMKEQADEKQTLSAQDSHRTDAEKELILADSIGPALLVVLDALAPAERVAFVLHDMFDMPFEEIGPIVGRTPAAARQLASRARRRVRGGAAPDEDLTRQREVVAAFLAAAREGNFAALFSLLDPNVTLQADAVAVQTATDYKWGGDPGLAEEVRGAKAVAATFNERRLAVQPALIDGLAGAIWAQGGRTMALWEFNIDDGKIVEIALSMAPERLASAVVVAG
jgi:RNA polymerase sigma-70 factor (ECF subfamily)